MLQTLKLPMIGGAEIEARLVSCLKKPGDSVQINEPLIEVETDKAIVEVPSPVGGTFGKLLVPIDALMAFDTPFAEIQSLDYVQSENDSETTTTLDKASDRKKIVEDNFANRPEDSAKEHAFTTPLGKGNDKRRFVTPAARKVIRSQGIDLENIIGSGPNGRVNLRDLPNVDLSTKSSLPAGRQEMLEQSLSVSSGLLNIRKNIRSNQAPTAVLVHGLFADLSAWSAVVSKLQSMNLNFLSLDLPGHGSTNSQADSTKKILSDLEEAVDALNLTDVILVGHSYGAMIAAKLAGSLARSTHCNVRSMILCAPVGLSTHINQDFLTGMVFSNSIESLKRELRKRGENLPFLSETQMRIKLEQLISNRACLLNLVNEISQNGVQQMNIHEDLYSLKKPTYIFWGGRDLITPFDRTSMQAPAWFRLLAQCGHIPHWESPSEVIETIIREMKL